MTRDALLVMVHGSPKPEANDEMFRVVEELKARPDAAARYPVVEVGFMECNEPTIDQAAEKCIERGATRIVAVPYFLHTGTHVCEDLPAMLDEVRSRHPNVTVLMSDYIGLSLRLTDLLAARTQAATLPSAE